MSGIFHLLRMLILARMRMHAGPSVSLASAGFSASPALLRSRALVWVSIGTDRECISLPDLLIHLAKVVPLGLIYIHLVSVVPGEVLLTRLVCYVSSSLTSLFTQ